MMPFHDDPPTYPPPPAPPPPVTWWEEALGVIVLTGLLGVGIGFWLIVGWAALRWLVGS